MSATPPIQAVPPTARSAVSLKFIRLARCAAEHGDNFRIYRRPYNKASPFSPSTQAHMVARLNAPDWKLVYSMSFEVERPFKPGWYCYVVELESVVQPITSLRYAFDAPIPGVISDILKARRAQARLDKAKGK